MLIRNVNKQNGLENGSLDDDDEEEHFVDSKNEESDREEENNQNDDDDDNDKKPKTTGATSWVHKKNIIHKRHDRYDHTERNPLYCGADKTLTYELLPFTRHYHPTVVVFANKLMNVSQLCPFHIFSQSYFKKIVFCLERTRRVHRRSHGRLYAHSLFGQICLQKSQKTKLQKWTK